MKQLPLIAVLALGCSKSPQPTVSPSPPAQEKTVSRPSSTKQSPMWLTTEAFGDTLNISQEEMDRILGADSFGKFAILSASHTTFIQAGNDWNPGPECAAFLKAHHSDPWILEYRDDTSRNLFRASSPLTLDQVRKAFRSYLANGREWKTEFTWQVIKR
jgi:hypothetical protein